MKNTASIIMDHFAVALADRRVHSKDGGPRLEQIVWEMWDSPTYQRYPTSTKKGFAVTSGLADVRDYSDTTVYLTQCYFNQLLN